MQSQWLGPAEILQSSPNTLTLSVQREGPVKVSFFGGLTLGRTGIPERTDDNVLWVASPLDLAATKVSVIQQRAERRDYIDVAELLRSGISLERALGAAGALYPDSFNPMVSLKALTYFRDGDLSSLSPEIQAFLAAAAGAVREVPSVARTSDRLDPGP